VNNKLFEKEPCRRASGSFRAFFSIKEEAEAFARPPPGTPITTATSHTVAGSADAGTFSRVEWLVPESARHMTGVN
jgi:hypothetical protein